MNLELNGQVAVVVGGARGLGQAIATAFAAEGARVAVVDLSPTPSAEFSLIADVTDFTAMKSAEAAIRSRFGRVDHLVFAAGIGSGKFGFPFWQLDPSDWHRVLN